MRIKEIGCTTLAIAGVVLLLVAIGIGSWGFRVYTAEWKGKGDAHIQIQSAENRIVQYERFFNLCVSVQNAETALDGEYKRLEQTQDTTERNRIFANISALQTTRANGINEYNASALKHYTDGQFLASNLPYQLVGGDYMLGETKTQCAS